MYDHLTFNDSVAIWKHFLPFNFNQTKQYSRSPRYGKWIKSYSFTRLHLLPQTSYGNNEKKQQLQTLHLYKVVSSSGAKKRLYIRGFSAVFSLWQCHLKRLNQTTMIAQWRYSEPFFPHASDFMTGPETRGVTLSWHSCTELHQYRPHNSCLHYHYQLCSSSNQVSKSQVKFTLCAAALRKRAAKKEKD